MNNFKTIKYIIENKLLDFSIRHLRRKAEELLSKGDTTVKLIKNSNNRNKYLIDINSLSKFQRIRAPKKVIPKTITNDSSKRIVQNHYDTNISINIKSDDNAKFGNYDYSYNKFIVETIFHSLKLNLYYIIEKENEFINHHHIHIGLKRGDRSLEQIKSEIEEILYNMFYISNEEYKDRSGNNRKVIYVENMISDYANREYLKKGSDHLGGIIPTFLTVKKRINAA